MLKGVLFAVLYIGARSGLVLATNIQLPKGTHTMVVQAVGVAVI